MPLAEKPLPVAVIPEMDTPADPVFVNRIAWVFAVPTGTLPNTAVCGVALTYPALAPLPPPLECLQVPVPARGRTNVPFAASLISFSCPDELPVVLGAKLTRNVSEPPAATLRGTEIPLARKPLPVTVSPETFTAALPVFDKVIVTVLVLPTRTLPKSTDPGFSVSWPLASAVGATLITNNKPNIDAARAARRNVGLLGWNERYLAKRY